MVLSHTELEMPWMTNRICQRWWDMTSKSSRHNITATSISVSWIAYCGWSQLPFCEDIQATLWRGPYGKEPTCQPHEWAFLEMFSPSPVRLLDDFRTQLTSDCNLMRDPRATPKFLTHREDYCCLRQLSFRVIFHEPRCKACHVPPGPGSYPSRPSPYRASWSPELICQLASRSPRPLCDLWLRPHLELSAGCWCPVLHLFL